MNKETIETIIANLAEKGYNIERKEIKDKPSMSIMAIVCFILSLEMLD